MIANRQPVRLGLDPFNSENPAVALPFSMPLWLALFGTLFIGYFLGAFGMYLSGRPKRQKMAAQKKELKQIKLALAESEKQLQAVLEERQQIADRQASAETPPDPEQVMSEGSTVKK